MNLKGMTIYGFKSFADKTELEFGKGITAVIGPNGCGKSNLVDAVRWALGEQSVKLLRGTRMEEIIFSGSETRKPLNFAEVSLTFTGAEALLDLEYDEVTVTRRLYRSGESEYFLNKSPCRLKDITELFLDTGVGKDIYSVIGQGRVDEIINSRPEDRREIFEEAAGILKYKLRKKEARRRLDETRENLVRVQDLILELDTQVEPLKEQAAVTRRYRILRDQVRTLEKEALAYKIISTAAELDTVEKQLQAVADSVAETAAESARREQQLQELNIRRQEQYERRSELEQERNVLAAKIEQQEGGLRLLDERENRFTDQLRENESRTAKLEELIAELDSQEKQLIQEYDQKREAARREQERNEELKQCLAELEKDSLLEEVESMQQRLHRANLQQEAAGTAARELRQQQQRLEQRRHLLEQEEAELKKQKETAAERCRQASAGQEKLQAELAEADRILGELAAARNERVCELEQLQQEELQCREQLQGLRSRLQLLQEQEAGLSGYYRGVREVLQARRRLPGVVGPVVDLLSVEEQYTRAIETALGGGLQFIVTEMELAARQAINFLKEENRGWATFLPLDTITYSATGPDRFPGWRELEGVIGKASELVTVEPSYRKIAEYLLGAVVVCRDLETAAGAARFTRYSCRVVTLDGDMINPGGAMRGGSVPRRNAAQPLSRRREIEELKAAEAGLEEQRRTWAEKMEQLRRKMGELDEQHQRQSAGRAALEQELNRVQKELESGKSEEKFIAEQLERVVQSQAALLAEKSELLDRLEQLEQQGEQVGVEREQLESELAGRKELYQQSLSRKKELEEQLTGSLIKLNSYREQEGNLQEKIQKTVQDRERLLEEKEQRIKEAAQIKEQLRGIDEKREELKQALEQLYQQSAAVAQLLAEHKHQADQVAAALIELEEQERRRQKRQGRMERQERELALEQTRLQTELNHLRQRYRELFADQPLQMPPSDFDLQGCEQMIQTLKGELEELGEVNLGAIEELDRLQERINFLTKQRADLEQGEISLNKVLAEIDRRMIYYFNRTFNTISQNMQDVFQELFQGGQVVLKLTDPEHPLESGIEISAQPPGKKLKNISLLSAGEKVLTALALLFAILRYKPAPFYFLDEVESALDDVNLDRFIAYLQRAAAGAQFIMVTHRRRTMEAADALYGVTMPESGVSKLLSIKLDRKVS